MRQIKGRLFALLWEGEGDARRLVFQETGTDVAGIPNNTSGDGPAAHPRCLAFLACSLVLCYSPHTLLATLWIRAILAHCSSSVSLLPISQLAKPHWGDR